MLAFAWPLGEMSGGMFGGRIGIFELPMALLCQHPADALAALDGCIVLHANALVTSGETVDFVAYHPAFDVVPPGTYVPQYRAEIIGGRRRWERIDEAGPDA